MSFKLNLRTFLLIGLITFGIMPGCNDFLECDINAPQYFDIFGVEVRHAIGTIGSIQFAEENSTSVIDNYFGIQISPDAQFYGLESSRKNSFSWIGSKLWASGPAIAGWGGSENEMLEDLQVTTLNDFDDTHPAGSTLNDLLSVRLFDGEQDLDSYIQQNNDRLIQIEDLPYILSLEKAPTADSVFQIRVSMTLSTGEEYSSESPKIFLLSN